MTGTMTTDESFGQMLRRLRRQAGLRQDELAEMVHTSDGSISHWENDKHPPSFGSVRALAEVLGAPELLAAAGFDPEEDESLRAQLEQQAVVLEELRRGQDELRQIVADLRSLIEGS